MKVKSLELKDFKKFKEVTINDFDPYLNLFIGINGAGKSSILDAISLLLSAFTSRLTTNNSKGVPIMEEYIRRGASSCSITLSLDNNIYWTKSKSRKLEKSEESNFNLLNEFTKNYRERLDSKVCESVPIIIHYGVKRSVTEIPLRFPKDDNTNPTVAYKDWRDSKASYRDIFPWLRGEEDYENEQRIDNPSFRSRGLEALRKALTNIFPGYTELKVRRKPRLEVILKKKEQELTLSQLSDGEKCYIALVCDIVRRLSLANPKKEILSGDGIVLIDEIDLHLHPSWEETVMPKLHSTFPNLQFIVSAHSPLVASNIQGKIYAVNDGKVLTLPTIFGLDYSQILQDWMGVSSENKEIASLISLLQSYTKHNMEKQILAIRKKLEEMKVDLSVYGFTKDN